MMPQSISGSVLLPLKEQLATATLTKYRELLRKLRANTDVVDESSGVFKQAKERVMYRLQQRNKFVKADPKRAFYRVRERFADRLAQARTSLIDLKTEQKHKLRQYYINTVLASSQQLDGIYQTASHGQNSAEQLQQQDMYAGKLQQTIGTDGLLRALVIGSIGGACKLFLRSTTTTTVQGMEIMKSALERPSGTPLITVSNHVGAVDDPLVTSAIVPPEYLGKPKTLRWTLCATDRCFKHAAMAPFFKAGKVLPVERGAGVSQFGMQVAKERLQQGDWVHIFPEGTRSKTSSMLPMRRGIGWLAANCDQPPLIVPFVHSGMEKIMPKGSALPKLGQELKVLIGEPIPVDDLLVAAAEKRWSERQLHTAITDRVGANLYALKAQLDSIGLEQVMPAPEAAVVALNEDSLLPLIEDEMDSMQHRWRKRWEKLDLSNWQDKLHAYATAALEHSNSQSVSFQDLDRVEPESEPQFSRSLQAYSSQQEMHPLEHLQRQQQQQGEEERVPTVMALQTAMGILRSSLVPVAATSTPQASVKLSTQDGIGSFAKLQFGSGDESNVTSLIESAMEYSALRVQHMKQYVLTAPVSKTYMNEHNLNSNQF